MTISTFKIANKLITGNGATEKLTEELHRLQVSNPLIVTDDILQKVGVVDQITPFLKGLSYEVFTGVKPDPELKIVEECVDVFTKGNHDSLIAIGGGSAIDIAKSVSALSSHHGSLGDLIGTDLVPQKGSPIITLPTTAGTGSEVTNISILSDKEAQLKKGIVSDYLLPDVAIVAPEMTLTMPPSVTAASGVDALVHAIEAYISVHASPITDALAIQAIQMISKNLPKAYANPDHIEARENMATASLMAGMAFGNAGVGAVHALAYPLGGRYNIAHGVSNALLLPYVMEWNKIACVERFRDIGDAFGEQVSHLSDSDAANHAVTAMERLCKEVNIPAGLRSFDIPEHDIKAMAEDASKIQRLLTNNPRKLGKEEIEQIYQSAY
ncbi:iron-containing alcohol dehydrogenase [Pontibacillus yanchengensis]|uniref:Iron-containing alcohol dehydrogenase n=2 Tax=Pontibacillus yanchengensis TaxID=462910 RepID=A0ACC7VIQ4_9BACI|nr:iron-containing alcohol dehydrogenase [Pontibacillus yanchengensis]MYL34361.1 iron-containing alcohol dehydrogenase [Pontibacillus yanchengensis]MYL53829.1 iron-containing alcohol dehydrogenase [Pontibacillus yanchengensis]